ncbi:MAG: heavy metal translocating P-type ATPase [Clostridia bacterium]
MEEENKKEKISIEFILNLFGIIIFIDGLILRLFSVKISMALFILSYILIGFNIFKSAIKHLFRKDMFDENFLMSIATIGALCIGEFGEGIAVLLFYKLGEYIQERAVRNSKNKIKKALELKSDFANLENGQEIIICDPKDLKIGDIIVVKYGEKVPVDGVVISGITKINTSAITGESIPKDVTKDDKILSGSLNIGSVIRVKVEKIYEKSTVAKIIKMIEESSQKKSYTEKFITKFAKVYTPIVVALSIIILFLLIFVFKIGVTNSISRALIFLVVSCPCALVISIPLSFFVGIGVCSKKGILVKGGNYLEALNKVKVVAFDKTGTLTTGEFKISNIKTLDDFSKERIIEYITLCEMYSSHYLAKSIISQCPFKLDKKRVSIHTEISGKGISAKIDSKDVLVGNIKLMREKNIEVEVESSNVTTIYLSVDYKLKGYITLEDVTKKGSENLVYELKKNGIDKVIMLTGDSQNIANEIGQKLKIDEVYAELLPDEKANKLDEIKSKLANREKIAYIGDGINDAPVIASADVGISMGKGTDIAIETSDIVLIENDPSKLIEAINISRKTSQVAMQNIIFAITLKTIFLVLSAMGLATMWEAVFADVGISLIAIINSTRIFRTKYNH